jgi:DNA recombination protein RmuC
MVEAIAAVVALVAGLAIGWFVWGRQLGSMSTELRSESVRRAAAETNLENERRALQSVQDSQARLAETFKALSAEALKSTSTQFLELARKELEVHQTGARADLDKRQQAIDAMVKPLQDSLKQVDGKLGELEKSRIAAYSALTEQVRGLVETQLPRLQGETANLVKALRQPGVRGRWGEMQLKRVVEMAQMLEHCDFVQQETRGNEDTGRLRPDLIVRLPGGKQVIVDAKTPLASYIDAIEAPDEATQAAKLADHARQVRDHMTSLGRKAYWEQFQPSPEFVVMFLPGEMFFSAALQQDATLIESGVAEKVIPATPTTLIALLRAVAYGWRQEALAKNAQEVADLGKQLYERIATMTDHWSTVGNRLDQAVKSYNDAVSSLESRVLVSARKLRDLKAGADDVEIAAIDQVERQPRKLQAVPTLPKPGQE